MNVAAVLEQFLRDIRFGARNLARSPSFTAIAIGSLALGIGGSAAMYSVIYAVILDPFPYKDVDRLMSVRVFDPAARGSNGSYYRVDQFLELAERNSVFEGVVASTWSDVIWTGAGDPQRLRGNHCTMNTFDVMGVPPLIGRAPAASDALDGAEPVTLLGFKFWQRQFGGDPGVLGRKLRLNDKVRTVVGVMPQRFMWRGADVYLPDVFHRGQTVEGEREVHLLGRLKPGITAAQGTAGLRPILDDLARQSPKDFPGAWRVELRSFKETFPSGIRDTLWILFGAVGLLLVIACLNVSNLLLSRAAYRQREIAIRASMGAGRLRLVGQLIAESLLLGVAGGLAGVALAFAGLQGIVAMTPPNTIPDEAKISMNAPVLLFTLAVSVAAAILFGLAPALHLSGRDLVTPLKESSRGSSGGARQRVVRGILIAGEVALSLMLLVGASLMIRTLLAVQGANLAFHPDRILTLRIPFSDQRYPDAARRNAFFQEVLNRMKAVPGVLAVGINEGLPPVYSPGAAVVAVGNPQQDNRMALISHINQDYPKVMGITLAQGRFLTEQEINAGIHTTVVNQLFVRRYFPQGSPLGQRVRIPGLRDITHQSLNETFQIAGVVGDTVNRAATNETLPEMFIPYTIVGQNDRVYVLCQGRAETLNRAIKGQVYAVDPGQPVMEDQSMETVLRLYVYARPRFNLLLFAVFAAFGLTLALLGLYGVISHAVAQQRREIGIRIALGATLGQVVRMVLAFGAKLLAVGIAAGLAGSLASVRLLSGLVRNVSTFDPYSFAGVAVLLFAAGLFASYWPARRAARVDPMAALRE